MLYIFDKDGTLCRSKSGETFINSVEDQELIPGVAERVAELKAQGHRIAIASNQGGVAFGFMSYDQADDIVMHAASLINADYWTFCPAHPGGKGRYAYESIYRKPNPGMIFECSIKRRVTNSEEIVFVGDRPEDEEAARRAGVCFLWADEFFGRDSDSQPATPEPAP